jgi:hypothetical protein
MPLSSILELSPSALGLFVVAVLASFVVLLLTTRLRRVIFGGKGHTDEANDLRSFLSNFD